MMALMLLVPLLACASALLCRSAYGYPTATVQTFQGCIIGHSASNHTHVNEFLGIPYAQPPISFLRFAAPQKYTKITNFNASKFVSSINLHLVAGDGADFVDFLVAVYSSPDVVAY